MTFRLNPFQSFIIEAKHHFFSCRGSLCHRSYTLLAAPWIIGLGSIALIAYCFYRYKWSGSPSTPPPKPKVTPLPPKAPEPTLKPAAPLTPPTDLNSAIPVQIVSTIERKQVLPPPPPPPVVTLIAPPPPAEPDELTDSIVFVERASTPAVPNSSTAEPKTLFQWAWGKMEEWFISHPDDTKAIKYRHIRDQLIDEKLAGRPPLPKNPDSVSKLAGVWNRLLDSLAYSPLNKSGDQHRDFVQALREGCELFTVNDERRFWICNLAYHRFRSVGLYSYFHDLIIHYTKGKAFPELSLDNFLKELAERNFELNHLPPEWAMPGFQRELKKLGNTLNFFADFLAGSNIPYVDGILQWADQKITILRHGTPVKHHDPVGLVGGIVDWWYDSKKTKVKDLIGSFPEITSDYLAFVEKARENKENILHVILENGDPKAIGDESARVDTRFALGDKFENFFPLALRLDGKFFAPHGDFKPSSVNQLIKDLIDQLSGQETGFKVDEKIFRNAKLISNLYTLLKEVKDLYFSQTDKIETIADHQAFILLSYAHITLYLCKTLNISILEALCKDDIDRGNVFKTVLKLHFLYLAKQITSENLIKVLVNTLVAPVVVRKDAMLESRSVLIEHAVKKIQEAFKAAPSPDNKYVIEKGCYHVVGNPAQSIFLRCSSAQNKESYDEYLEHVSKMPSIPLAVNTGITNLETDRVKQDATTIKNTIQPQLITDATAALKALFDNPKLGLTLSMREEAETRFEWKIGEKNAGLTFTAFFKITSGDNKMVAGLKAVIEIPDHRKGEAGIKVEKTLH